MNSTAPPALTIPLSQAARNQARQFAAEQATPEKGTRVYFNTLAVWAVSRYLRWLHVDADLSASDSWHPNLRALFDVADLVLPQIGRVECRPVLPGQDSVPLPPEATQNRIGYLVVRIDWETSLDRAELLGFTRASPTADTPEVLEIAALEPLDAFLDYLTQLERAATPPVQLSRWLQNQFEAGWQAIEAVLTPPTPSFAVRGTAARRAKRMEWDTSPVILVVSIAAEGRETASIHLQLYPADMGNFPPNLTLQILTGAGELFREIVASPGDTFIQYQFRGERGERFSLHLSSGDARISETFAI